MSGINARGRRTYTLWAPFYDFLVGAPIILKPRRRAIQALDLRTGERLHLVGIGTGTDIPLLPDDIAAIGIDLTAAMLRRARRKADTGRLQVTLVQADAENIPLADASCDKALLALILSVVPHPRECLHEALRVLRPGGCAVIFDKFLPEGQRPSVGRRLFNLVTRLFGTDINRRLCDITARLGGDVLLDEPRPREGPYRIIVIRKSAMARSMKPAAD